MTSYVLKRGCVTSFRSFDLTSDGFEARLSLQQLPVTDPSSRALRGRSKICRTKRCFRLVDVTSAEWGEAMLEERSRKIRSAFSTLLLKGCVCC